MENEMQIKQLREIRIYSSLANKTIKSAATTWGELQRDLAEYNITYSGMNAFIGETKTALMVDESVLKEGIFTLFLTPIKTKSGMELSEMGYKDLRAAIKLAIDTKGDLAKEHFNQDKNYTTKGTEVLRELLKEWNAKTKVQYQAPKEKASEVKEVKPEKEKTSKPKKESSVKKEETVEEVQIPVNQSLENRISKLEQQVAELLAKDCPPAKEVIVEVEKQAKTKFDTSTGWERDAERDYERLKNKL